jgi:hypothetical protein
MKQCAGIQHSSAWSPNTQWLARENALQTRAVRADDGIEGWVRGCGAISRCKEAFFEATAWDLHQGSPLAVFVVDIVISPSLPISLSLLFAKGCSGINSWNLQVSALLGPGH